VSRRLIGFAGMTHLGVNSAVAAAERGFSVIGFDRDGDQITALQQGKPSSVEPDLPELLAKNRARITFSTVADTLRSCDVVYIAEDVPTDDGGLSDLGPVRSLIDDVSRAMSVDGVLVVLSQVPPGFTRRLPRPPASTFYQVETLIFGRAVERALQPERFIVGCADPRTPLPGALAEFLGAFGCPILTMSYESAELSKISINMCLVASISTANTIAELCERIGADWSDIVPALRLDRRVGPHAYLAPGLGIAGGNLERDLRTFCHLADRHGTDASVVRAWIANSDHRRDWVLGQLHERVIAKTPEPTVAVLGLAYKPDTSSTKNSPALALLAALAPFPVRAYDPVVTPRPEYHPRLVRATSALDACAAADAVAIMTPWAEFRRLAPAAVAARLRGRTVIDPYAVLDAGACRASGLEHVTLGAPLPRGAV